MVRQELEGEQGIAVSLRTVERALEPNAAYLFFQLISRCYQCGSVLITSNRPVMEWGEVFGDQG